MKILHVMDHYTPNLGYQENFLPYHQKKLGHDVEIITSKFIPEKRKTKDEYNFEKEVYYYKGVKTHRLNSWMNVEGIGAVVKRGLIKKIKKINPDIIHVHEIYTPSAIRCAKYAKNNNTRLYVDNHIDNDNFHPDQFYKKILVTVHDYFLFNYVFKRTSKFIAVNPYSKRYMKDNLSIPENKIEYLPLGVDKKKFYPDQNFRKRTRERLGVEDELLIISSGFFEENKDIDILLKAFSRIIKKSDDAKLLLLGEGSQNYMDKVHNLVEKKEINDNVIFHDFVDHSELPKFYNAADLGVYPGKLGITIVEAMATGMPVIVCDSEATNYIISNDNGFSIERGNVNDLTEKILRYIEDSSLMKKHRKNAVELVKKELSWKKIAEKSIEIYNGNSL